LDTTIKGVGSD